jgi:sortase B
MEIRIIRVLDSIVDALVICVCVLLICIGVYSFYDNLYVYENAQDRSILAYKPPLNKTLADMKAEAEEEARQTGEEARTVVLNKQVAWLYVEDTPIDFPVVQGEDNYEFLNKNVKGEFSLSGAIFLDSRSDPLFRDEYSLIYGHHMEYGVMFGSLDSFRDKEYFSAHRQGTIVTEDAVYELTLFAVVDGEASDPYLFQPHRHTALEMIGRLRKGSVVFTEPEEGCRIVAMSTCSADSYMSRLLVFGTIKGIDE